MNPFASALEQNAGEPLLKTKWDWRAESLLPPRRLRYRIAKRPRRVTLDDASNFDISQLGQSASFPRLCVSTSTSL